MSLDTHPGRVRTLAGFLGDAERIPTLEPITTRARQLNPDLWPDAVAVGARFLRNDGLTNRDWLDELRPSPIPPKA